MSSNNVKFSYVRDGMTFAPVACVAQVGNRYGVCIIPTGKSVDRSLVRSIAEGRARQTVGRPEQSRGHMTVNLSNAVVVMPAKLPNRCLVQYDSNSSMDDVVSIETAIFDHIHFMNSKRPEWESSDAEKILTE